MNLIVFATEGISVLAIFTARFYRQVKVWVVDFVKFDVWIVDLCKELVRCIDLAKNWCKASCILSHNHLAPHSAQLFDQFGADALVRDDAVDLFHWEGLA